MSIHPLKDKPISVTVNTTPNEHAFNCMEEAKDFPVAAKIFKNADVASIFIMAEADGGFISVTKKTEANWNDLKDEIVAGIKAVL